jgi:hypothetical protein
MPVIAILRDDGNAVVHRVQLGFFTEPPRTGVRRVFSYGQPYSLRAFAPFQVIRSFGVPFLVIIDKHNIRLNPTVGRQQNAAIPPSVRGLDSLGEIDFSIGHG